MFVRKALSLAPWVAVVVAACASHQAPDRGVAEPQTPEPTVDIVPPSVVDTLATRDYARALAVVETASAAATSPSPWLEYDRAEALAGLGRTDEAIVAFEGAEQRFRSEGDDAGESAALWGHARALAEAGRCPEARTAFGEYAAFVRASDPAAAELAATRSRECRPVVLLH